MLSYPLGKANSLKDIREVMADNNHLCNQLSQSLKQPKHLLNEQMKRLSMKDKQFCTFKPAGDESMERMWLNCLKIDPLLAVSNHLCLQNYV